MSIRILLTKVDDTVWVCFPEFVPAIKIFKLEPQLSLTQKGVLPW